MGSALAAQTNPTSCSVSYDNRSSPGVMNGTIPPAVAAADASISGTFSVTSVSFTGHASGDATGAATAQASFNETVSLLLYTPGPVRSGFITFTSLDPFSPGPPTGQTAQVSVGPYSASCSASGCVDDLGARPGLASFTLPFTLGEQYLFSETFTVDFSYVLTDAAGNLVAPFEAATAPEPTSVSLCVLGISLLALGTRRRRQTRRMTTA